MNAMQSFFKKYNAVPADDIGPQFPRASNEALIAHATALIKAWDEQPDTRGVILAEMKDAQRELFARQIAAQWLAICERIGFGPK